MARERCAGSLGRHRDINLIPSGHSAAVAFASDDERELDYTLVARRSESPLTLAIVA